MTAASRSVEAWDRVLFALRRDRGAPERRLNAVLGPVLAQLPEPDARALREALPGEARALLHVAAPGEPLADAEAFYTTVALRAGLPPGAARELAQLVLAAVGQGLGAEQRGRLARHLPASVAALFSGADRSVPGEVQPEVTGRIARGGHTLATGRPGSQQPVSESRPGSAHPLSEARPERAQQYSVVRASEPHADTKLSSSRGLTQEREKESLAEGGRPDGNG